MTTILVSVDFSDGTPLVVDEALGMSRAFGGRLIILSVLQPPGVTRVDVMAQTTANLALLAAEAAEIQLTALKKRIVQAGITVESKQRVGMPGPAIVEMASIVSADYILLGSHGHGALYDLIVGSTTSYVLNNAQCPVIVVPTRGSHRALRATTGVSAVIST